MNNKIRYISLALRIIFILAFIFLPVFTVLFWLTNGEPLGSWTMFSIFPYTGPPLPFLSTLPVMYKWLGFLINMIPIAIYMAITYFLIGLFRQFEREQIFTIENAKHIRWIGWLMLISEIVRPFYTLLLTFTLTYSYPPGYRFAYVGLNIQNVAMAIIAMLIILVSWIMQEGVKIREENSLTV